MGQKSTVPSLIDCDSTQKILGGQYVCDPSVAPSQPISAYQLSLIVFREIYFWFQYVTSQIGVFSAAFEWA